MYRNLVRIFFFVLLLFCFYTFLTKGIAQAAAPTITSFTPSATQVGQYQKLEVTFSISQSYPAGSMLPYYYYDASDTSTADPGRNSPYGVDGISIDAHFTSPSGKQSAVPAFYYQDYARSGDLTSGETMTATNNYSWKVRFAPEEQGTYKYYISIVNKGGSSVYPSSGTLSFNSIASSSKGFLRTSSIDPRFLAFENGSSFVPIASGHQWWKCCGARSWDYENAFNNFGANGINLVRIWDQNDGYGLTVEGHFDAYSYPGDYTPSSDSVAAALPKGTQMNQRGNYEEDKIIEAAQRNGVYVELSSHGDPYWIWDASVYKEGWNSNPTTFSDWRHINYWKRNFRYRVARWGYSTSILSWENWNETGNILPGTDIYNFYQTYGAYMKQTDPYSHLRTTSMGSQVYSPAFWSSAGMDMANYHDYMMSSRYPASLTNDEANFVARFSWCLGTDGKYCGTDLGLGDGTSWTGVAKPWIWGEIDVGTTVWNQVNPKVQSGDARLRMLHNTTWAGLFTPMGTSPLDWYWDQEDAATTQGRYADRKITSSLLSGINYAGGLFTYLASSADIPPGYAGETITVSNDGGKARVYAMRRADKKAAYLWVQNRDYTWYNSPSVPAAITPTVMIGNLLTTDSYNISVWNTHTGVLIKSSTQTPQSGLISVNLTDLATDQLIKIESTTLPITTSVPVTVLPTSSSSTTPVPTAGTVTIGNGDVNGDGLVNFLDVKVILSNWQQVVALTSPLDQYNDGSGIVDSLSFAVVANKIATSVTATPSQQPFATLIPTATPTKAPIPTVTPTLSVSTPTPTPITQAVSGSEWTQFGHDAQHTNNTVQAVATPWKYLWQWNGADTNGQPQANHLSVPDLVQPITGGGRVYMVAGDSVYALNSTNGSVIWSKGSIGTLNSTPAYDAVGYLYVASGNNNLYKLDATNGNIVGTFSASSALNLAPLYANGTVYVGSSGGILYAVGSSTMNQVWQYNAGSSVATPAVYSPSRNLVIIVAHDLNIHAVNASNGLLKWKVKPTVRNYQCVNYAGDSCNVYDTNGAQAENGWPVIAEQHGIVFVKYRMDWNSLWTWSPYPTTNSAIRSNLVGQPNQQSLFALSLDTGSSAFIPAVGVAGSSDGGNSAIGPLPVISVQNGQEVAYVPWRNGQLDPNTNGTDARGDFHVGEMELDSSTITGYQAGDLRFVSYQFFPTDETMQMTMAGNTLFYNHWLVAAAQTITNRASTLGDSPSNSIKTSINPFIIWREGPASYAPCTYDAATRYCTPNLLSYADTREYPAGFYEYYNSQKSGSLAYAIVSNNLVLVKTGDGGIIALQNGNPLSMSSQTQILAGVNQSRMLGTDISKTINYTDANKYLNQTVTVEGVVGDAVNRLPKAIYLPFEKFHDGKFQIRIFNKDIHKFSYDPMGLKGKHIEVTGKITLYPSVPGPEAPEIIVSDPSQIKIIENSGNILTNIWLFISNIIKHL